MTHVCGFNSAQDKKTGEYVIRRCHDVKPGLASLPCDPFASGSADRMLFPWRTLFIEHNRVILFNEVSMQFGVYSYDADVQNGGDPVCCPLLCELFQTHRSQFHFSLPSLHSGYIDPFFDVFGADIVHLALPNGGGELIVSHKAGLVQVIVESFAPFN